MGDPIIHRGMGSDLMALCGKMQGISGHDQVRLSYVDDQVTCVECLRVRCVKLKEVNDMTVSGFRSRLGDVIRRIGPARRPEDIKAVLEEIYNSTRPM